MKYMKVVLLTLLVLGVNACASVETMREVGGNGTANVYNVSYDKAWEASKDAVVDAGGRLNEEDKAQGYIIGTFGMSAFSWGEKVSIFLTALDKNATEVEVVSKRALATNVTAKNWEPTIHKQIKNNLQ